MLEHVHAIAHGDGQRPPAAALPHHVHDDGGGQARHLAQVVGDGFRLPALLGVRARVGSLRVHEGEDGTAELGRDLHHAQRLSVALRLGHPEVAVDLLLGVAPLLMADHGHRALLVAGEPGHERGIVAEAPVPVQLRELGEEGGHVVERVGPVGMAGDERLLPGREARVDGAAPLGQLLPQPAGLLLLGRVAGEGGQLVDALLEGQERRLEIIRHSPDSTMASRSCGRGSASRGRAAPPPPGAGPRPGARGSRRSAPPPPRRSPGAPSPA